MIVSEPPDDTDSQRWNIEKLAELGLSAEGRRRHGARIKSREDPHHSRSTLGQLEHRERGPVLMFHVKQFEVL